MFTQKSINIFRSVQEIRPFSLFQNLTLGRASTDDKCPFAIVSLFSEFEPRQKLNQSQMSFDNLMGYILSISICMHNFITIFHSVQEIVHYHVFRIWSSAKPRPMKHVISKSLGLDLVNINVFAKFYQNIPNGLRVKFHYFHNLNRASFTFFFRIWTSAKTRPITNIIWLSRGLHRVNINVYAKFHHNILLSSRDRAIFTYSEFGARLSLDRW